MSTLYENIMALCEEKGIKGGKMCTDLGISKGIMTNLRYGRKKGINAATAQKIADYFGVSVDRVLGLEEKSSPSVSEAELDSKLIDALVDLTPEEAEKARVFIMGLKAARK